MFRADLHIHSRFSRATSKNLTLRNLASHAYIKGIHLIGTGDCTHPAWLQEIEEELTYDDNTGFYRLKIPLGTQDIAEQTNIRLKQVSFQPQFVLQGEISCIYKKNNAVRKNHQLIYAPDIETAKKINEKLAKIGNLSADGRPMLGLDAKILLEYVLEEKQSHLIPAHIWTPWFSIFGSKSGFNTLEECFGDLTEEIFALETGLSSDPTMNRLCSALDRYVLISNSDAHSGENLGREANIFHSAPTYQSLFESLRRKNTFLYGTIEFYPEEGKYFADGHRNCKICFMPDESENHQNICPVCGKPLTIGVLNRVMELADRKSPLTAKEQFESCVPLKEILAEIHQTGAKSKKIHSHYEKLINSYGNELDILQNVPIETISHENNMLAKALYNMRTDAVRKTYGFDGEYGKIHILQLDKKKRVN